MAVPLGRPSRRGDRGTESQDSLCGWREMWGWAFQKSSDWEEAKIKDNAGQVQGAVRLMWKNEKVEVERVIGDKEVRIIMVQNFGISEYEALLRGEIRLG